MKTITENQNPKILIIDDDRDCREVLKMRLELFGFHVLEAIEGGEGIELARREHPRLIFLDITMPLIDGWQVCRALKEDSRTQGIPVAIMTARDESSYQKRSFESGADAYLAKPWEATEIASILEKFMLGDGRLCHGR